MVAIIEIVCTLLVIFLLVYGIIKKFNTPTLMLAIGLISLIIYSLVTGTSVLGDKTTGSTFLDVFELVKNKFSSNLSGTCLLIMSVMGFVKYLDHIKASKLLALYAAKPLKKLGKPYLVCALGIVIASVLKLCVPSASGLSSLLMATMYPLFIAAGCTKLTAITAINIGVCFDLGPACPITTWACSQEPVAALTDVTSFFVNYQLWRTAIVILVSIIVFVIVNKRADQKLGSVDAEEIEEVDPKSLGVPAFYAVLPLLPLVLVLVFSKLITGIVLSVPAANFLGFTVAFIVNLICAKGDKKAVFNGGGEFWKGMGASMANVVCLICCASVFSAGLDIIGGTKLLMSAIGNSSLGGYLIVFFAATVNFLMVVVTGSGVASSYAILPMLYPAVEASNINLLVVVFAIVASGGLGRAVSPVAANNIIVCSSTGSDVMEVSKRGTLPMVCSFVVMLVLALIAL